ncbi:MAG TPA: nitronate monooxygenase family protein [Kofleriaceae bacterium]|nr:nitronate monooxygenase family protein [Kofleriaceae bacterium]
MFGTELPIVLAPMAGFGTVGLAVAVANAGGLGSLACASISIDEAAAQIAAYRACGKPLNVNFFCHTTPTGDDESWRAKLAPYYAEFAITSATPGTPRRPFDAAACALVERMKPEIVSFHFGLPPGELLARIKATGARVISSATTVREAVWLAERGCDAIIAQGAEAGGHRGMFLTDDVAAQPGTFALVPQVVDAVRVPVIAAGGIADARGIAAAFALGASAVQLGTAYLACPEANVTAIHRRALATATDDSTAITNVFSGRPARGIINRAIRELGPMSAAAPPFPLASAALAPIRAKSEAAGSGDFTNLWAGQAAKLARAGEPAFELTRRLARETHELLRKLAVTA